MKKAFTLIELLVVIAIIAILAAMLMPALARAREEARKGACKGNCHNVGLAQAMYRNDYNAFPNALPSSNESCLGALYPVYVEAVQTFDCPGGPTNEAVYTEKSTLTTDDQVADADYLHDTTVPSHASGARIVYADNFSPANHKDGSNALFKDAHVDFVKGDVQGTFENPEEADADTCMYLYDDAAGTGRASVEDAALFDAK